MYKVIRQPESLSPKAVSFISFIVLGINSALGLSCKFVNFGDRVRLEIIQPHYTITSFPTTIKFQFFKRQPKDLRWYLRSICFIADTATLLDQRVKGDQVEPALEAFILGHPHLKEVYYTALFKRAYEASRYQAYFAGYFPNSSRNANPPRSTACAN
ncbi:hypothetical protein ABW19_dt0207254 [Dactylella cylindrospora]|nr:hypothetical protein ABW19_dt0207254 [Dactylella cylindrospora]